MKEKYAIWCSSSTDHTAILNNFVETKNGSKFVLDFNLKDSFIDYDHVIIIWYGEKQGELGDIFIEQNDNLDPYFNFIIEPVAIKLKNKNIDKISYLIAIPDFEYNLDIKNNGQLFFVGNIEHEIKPSHWLEQILTNM
ncbi:hypothetical protein ID854_06155 [Xenorhabdus sp. M]|uniref:Uncharacterized protein n=1 Tax=Xenorhabdus szentirmaii TaxID=290112 RepID=A0AAW3YQZ5_9GAMM|nr:hypothetical protein [Xenorhabdus sp. M]MBD2800051.1 hypothetical protein [Xenorhabdus sp. M]